MANMGKKELREMREQMIGQMEQKLHENWSSEEDSLFYYHSSEDRVVLSHALFWVMSRPLKGPVTKEKFFLLLRQYEEEMLDAFLMEGEEFQELLHYCNVLYETLPLILTGVHNLRVEKDARKLAATAIVAAGYAGDMPEDLSEELLDSLDFEYNKVRSRRIEQMLPQLNKMVEHEMESMIWGK